MNESDYLRHILQDVDDISSGLKRTMKEVEELKNKLRRKIEALGETRLESPTAKRLREKLSRKGLYADYEYLVLRGGPIMRACSHNNEE